MLLVINLWKRTAYFCLVLQDEAESFLVIVLSASTRIEWCEPLLSILHLISLSAFGTSVFSSPPSSRCSNPKLTQILLLILCLFFHSFWMLLAGYHATSYRFRYTGLGLSFCMCQWNRPSPTYKNIC